MARPKLLADNFTLYLVATVAVASFLPCHGEVAVAFNWVTDIAIGLLFFLHGAKLSRQAIVAGAIHWRLHLLVLLCTFAVFPLLGLALKPVLAPLVTPVLYTGVLFLCTLSSTMQSSIAFTSIAKGNVPAAVCSASASSLLGIFLSPVLIGLVIFHQDTAAGSHLHSIGNIVLQLLVPFVAGQLLRPWIGAWIDGHGRVLKGVDQGSILLVVYTAFSEAVRQGLWHRTPLSALGGVVLIDIVLLIMALVITSMAAKRLGFSRADQITVVFCGSKKSLAAGIPMAKVLFAGQAVGAILLPLMLFHQIQLMICAMLAQRWSTQAQPAARQAAGSRRGAPGAPLPPLPPRG